MVMISFIFIIKFTSYDLLLSVCDKRDEESTTILCSFYLFLKKLKKICKRDCSDLYNRYNIGTTLFLRRIVTIRDFKSI